MIKRSIPYCLLVFILFISSNHLFAQVPVIKSVDIRSGFAGQLVGIKGDNFEATSRVFFGNAEATVVSTSSQLIEARVPSSTTFDYITVLNTSSNLSGTSKTKFFLSFGGSTGVSPTDFDPQVDVFAESGLFDICVCDLDGGGMNDIIGANSKDNKVTLLRNLSTPGNLSFVKTALNLGITTLNTNCEDLNGDGKPEVIFSEGSDGDRLFILVNSSSPGSLSFSLQSITLTGAATKRIEVEDLDLDGKPDLIVTDQSVNNVYIIKNTSTGGTLSFDSNITTLTVAGAASTAGLEIADLNNDERPEIIVNQFLTDGGGFYVSENESTVGDLSFSAFQQFESSGTFVNLKAVDLNNDGKLDIAASLFLSTSIAIFLNETATAGATPQFGSSETISTDKRPWGIDIGDMDGDGTQDIAVATVGEDLAVDILQKADANSTKFNTVSIDANFINRNIKVADVDGDAKPDVIFSSVDDESQGINSSEVSILRNNKCIIPIITPEGPITTCSGNPITLESQLITGATYEWRDGGTVVKSGSDHFLDVIATGDYTVTIISENGACSEVSPTVNIEVKAGGALPSPNLTSNSPVCIGGTLNLTSEDVGADQYVWSGPNSFMDVGISVSINDFNVSKSGRYYVDIYSGDCIVETKSILIETISSPTFFASQSGTGIYCSGEAISLSVSPVDANFTYQWFDDSGSISGATGASFSPTSSGTYYVEATDQINTSCPPIPTNEVTIEVLSLPIADFNNPNSSCSNTAVSFENTSTIDGAATANYLWDFGDGNTSTAQNPSNTYTSDGDFDATLTVSYEGLPSCQDDITKSISITGNINVEIESTASTLCEGEELTLSTSAEFDSYSWSNGSTEPSITIATGGSYSVTVTDENGCEASDNITIDELDAPQVEITSSANNISPGDTVTLVVTGLTDATWSPGTSVSDSTSTETTASLIATTLFTVRGTGENGCPASSEIEIIVLQDQIGSILQPKKYFSPNDDTVNDVWVIDKIDQFPDCSIEIFDQTGNRIYEAQPYLNDWDGTSKGSDVPNGVYYFVIKCGGSEIVKSGSITLLRK